MRPTVTVTEKRNPRIEKMLSDLLAKAKVRSVKVGYWVGENHEEDGTDLTVVARANEYGTKRIPQRSFLRSTVDEDREVINRFMENQLRAYTEGKNSLLGAITGIGVKVVGLVKSKIKKSKSWAVPNSPVTIALKGSSTPLVDTGEMRNKVDYRVDFEG